MGGSLNRVILPRKREHRKVRALKFALLSIKGEKSMNFYRQTYAFWTNTKRASPLFTFCAGTRPKQGIREPVRVVLFCLNFFVAFWAKFQVFSRVFQLIVSAKRPKFSFARAFGARDMIIWGPKRAAVTIKTRHLPAYAFCRFCFRSWQASC